MEGGPMRKRPFLAVFVCAFALAGAASANPMDLTLSRLFDESACTREALGRPDNSSGHVFPELAFMAFAVVAIGHHFHELFDKFLAAVFAEIERAFRNTPRGEHAISVQKIYFETIARRKGEKNSITH